MKLFKILSISFLFITVGFSQLDYSLEDMNTTSLSFGSDVWAPFYTDYITMHYFSSQG